MKMEEIRIHKTAIVDSKAKIADDVEIGPYTVVGPEVTIGKNVKIASHCIIKGKTTIGKDCQIFPGAVIGEVPQDKKFSGGKGICLEIGEGNIIREYVTIHLGTLEGGGKTIIGNNNLLMAYSHVAHDCVVGNHCVMANVGTLGGHVTLEDNAVVGGLSAVHQFVRVGRLAIIGGCTKVVQDIPPFSMCDGHPAKVFNVNLIGLKRANISKETILLLKQAFKILFSAGLSKTHAIEKIEKEIQPTPEVEHLIFFAKTTKRGLCS